MVIRNASELGLLLRQARRDARMTQAELAGKAEVSTRWIIGMEKGKGTAELHLVFRVLAALGLGLDIAPLGTPPAEALKQASGPGADRPVRSVLTDRSADAEGRVLSITEVMKKLADRQ